MKALSSLIGGVLACAMAEARVVEEEHSLVLEMTVSEVEQMSGGGLRMVSVGSVGSTGSDEWGIVVRVPGAKPRRWPNAPKPYRFYVFLEPRDERSRELLDEVLTKKYPGEGRQSLFKAGGYEAVSPILPQKFGRAGGWFALADPGVGSSMAWNISVAFDATKRTLVMRIAEARY